MSRSFSEPPNAPWRVADGDGDYPLCRKRCANSYIPGVLHQWREPKHSALEPRNVWSLFNALIETLKDGNLAERPKRTEALRGLPDVAVGLGLN